MNVVVTGGAGFIGSAVCGELVRRGVSSIVAVDDLSTGSSANLVDLPVTLAVGSVLDAEFLDRSLAEADAVVHLAALPSVPRSLLDPVASHEANVTGTLRVLEAARKIGAYVLVASSSSVYGLAPGLPKQETAATRPASPYAASKLAAESYTLAYQHSFGLPTMAVRLFNVFGPRQPLDSPYAAIVPRLIGGAVFGRGVEIYGDGQQTRDFTYVGSVARVLCDAVRDRVVHDQPVNLAFGGSTSVLGLAQMIGQIVGREAPLTFAPSRPGEVPHSRADPTALLALFPDARPRDLSAALQETVDWYTTSPRAAGPGSIGRQRTGDRDQADSSART